MNYEKCIKNLEVPNRKVDVVLDTDAFNEIDDQFAIAYMLKSEEKLDVKAIYAAPFYEPVMNKKSDSPEDGMIKSYDEIAKVLKLADREDLGKCVFKGATSFLENEDTPVTSNAAHHLATLAKKYSPENPLYVIAIAAITNVASAILLEPSIADNIVVVWLGGHSLDMENTAEFNMVQDIAAARVVFMSGAPVVQLPCDGVVSSFTISGPELKEYLIGENDLADYLASNTIREAESYASGKPWTRPIWDVTAVAWLMNDNECFMKSRIINAHIPNYDKQYNYRKGNNYMNYVYHIKRDALMEDLINKLKK